MMHDVVNTLLTVGYHLCQTTVKPLDYLTQEDSRLTERVEECCCGASEQFLR